MIALSGIFFALAILFMLVCNVIERESHRMPTQEEEDDLVRKLNRVALDRANKENNKR